jgi:hypothetical protein
LPVIRETSPQRPDPVGAFGVSGAPQARHKSFRMNTYRRTPRFSRNRPKSSARKSPRINTYRLRVCNPFRFRTYKKQGEGDGLPVAPRSFALFCTLVQKSEAHPLSPQAFALSLQKHRGGTGFQGLYLQALSEEVVLANPE